MMDLLVCTLLPSEKWLGTTVIGCMPSTTLTDCLPTNVTILKVSLCFKLAYRKCLKTKVLMCVLNDNAQRGQNICHYRKEEEEEE